MTTTTIEQIPKDILELIPVFNGDKRQLNLYLRKCQYVVDRFKGSVEQNLYVFNAITSRLREGAAALLSEREDIVNWSALKELLIQHFGDPRSEACINIELESLKIKSGESFLDFCNRIQGVRSLLMSKVNTIDNEELKRAKLIIYNNTALNVFLYNLPENMVRIVRLKAPETLEAALSIVLEEVNFLEQYNTRNRLHGTNQTLGNKPLMPSQSKFNFYNSQNAQKSIPGFTGQGQMLRPVFGYRPQPSLQPQQFGYKPPQQFGYRPPQQFGYRPPQHFGYRPFQPVGFKPSQQIGYRPPLQFGYRPPQQFGNKPVQQFQSNVPQVSKDQDVSMRTAPPRPQGFALNELNLNDYECGYMDPYVCMNEYEHYDEYYSDNTFNDYDDSTELNDKYDMDNSHVTDIALESTNDSQNINFRKDASSRNKKS